MTAATFDFTGSTDSCKNRFFYIGYDGYPKGAAYMLDALRDRADSDDFVNLPDDAIALSYDKRMGESEPTGLFHGTSYHYRISANCERVQCLRAEHPCPEAPATAWVPIFEGTFREFTNWAIQYGPAA